MKVTFAVGKLTIDRADGARQVVTFGGRGADMRGAAADDGSIAEAVEAAAADGPVILWDEAGSEPALPLAVRSG